MDRKVRYFSTSSSIRLFLSKYCVLVIKHSIFARSFSYFWEHLLILLLATFVRSMMMMEFDFFWDAERDENVEYFTVRCEIWNIWNNHSAHSRSHFGWNHTKTKNTLQNLMNFSEKNLLILTFSHPLHTDIHSMTQNTLHYLPKSRVEFTSCPIASRRKRAASFVHCYDEIPRSESPAKTCSTIPGCETMTIIVKSSVPSRTCRRSTISVCPSGMRIRKMTVKFQVSETTSKRSKVGELLRWHNSSNNTTMIWKRESRMQVGNLTSPLWWYKRKKVEKRNEETFCDRSETTLLVEK